VSNRVPTTRPAAPANQRDRGDHKIDELTRQASSVIIWLYFISKILCVIIFIIDE